MYKEIAETIKSIMRPIIELPSFVDENKKPLDLITTLVALYDTSENTDRYVRFVENHDMIYVLYRDLMKDHRVPMMRGTLLYRGKICQVYIVDYDIIVNERDTDICLKLIMALCEDAGIHILTKNMDILARSCAQALKFVMTNAATFMFVDVATSVFSDTEELREGMIRTLNTYNTIVLTPSILNNYINLIKNHGIEMLLDCSLISYMMEKQDEPKE